MIFTSFRKPLLWVGAVLAMWLGVKYLLPVALPFLLGALLAVAAEPAVVIAQRKMPRQLASPVGVTVVLLLLAGLVSILGAVAVREIKNLALAAPELAQKAGQGIQTVQDWLVSASEQAPEGIRPLLQHATTDLFEDGAGLVQQVTQRLPSALTATLGHVGNGALGLGTGLLSAFLISVRLPQLKAQLRGYLQHSRLQQLLPGLRRVKSSLGGWLVAQLKLSAVTWGIVSVGFFILGIPYAPVWAVLVAVVDAIPILGTGTVLVPWALVCLLQRQSLRAIGLLCTYGAAAITRTVLEPKLVGRHLGLDPLTTLIALYAGYRFWGVLGLLLTPIIASAVKSLLKDPENGIS